MEEAEGFWFDKCMRFSSQLFCCAITRNANESRYVAHTHQHLTKCFLEQQGQSIEFNMVLVGIFFFQKHQFTFFFFFYFYFFEKFICAQVLFLGKDEKTRLKSDNEKTDILSSCKLLSVLQGKITPQLPPCLIFCLAGKRWRTAKCCKC